jgi:hypothetical protein
MTTLTLRPTGESTDTTHWQISGAPSRWQAVDEEVADDAATTIDASGQAQNGYRTRVTFPASGLHPLTVVNSVTFYWRGRKIGAGTPTCDLEVNDVAQFSDESFGAFNDWTDKSKLLNDVPGGSGWSVADVDAMNIGALSKTNNTEAIQITQMYAVVDYEVVPEAPEAAGGWW